MQSHYYAVIMAGGGGTRLWPLSRQARPKQMVRLGGERTLFQLAVDRLEGLFLPENTLVVTVAEQISALRSQCPDIPLENFLVEPMPRGTASVVGLAAAALRRRDPQAVMVMLGADHFIRDVAYFQQILIHSYDLAMDGHLVTLGIRPTYPATGYGYIQRGEALAGYAFPAYQVQRFKEKPDLAAARTFMERGDHDWNSGMFIWRVDRIWEEFQRLMPALFENLLKIEQAWGTPQQTEVVQSIWPGIKPETIDYGIMERAGRVVVIPAADMGWNDVGSWESLFDVFSPDENGNIILDAQHIGLNTANSLILADQTGRLVVTLGVHDLVVVDTKDAVLVCSRQEAQKVKDVVNLLKQREDDRRYL
jgi:mannose-1-phosphate guanylyltransferase